jgi:FAD/FMN-containing dehydrogenase
VKEHELIDQLVGIVGADQVLTTPDLMAAYLTDWTGQCRGDAIAVVRPESVHNIIDILQTCYVAGVSVVPQGGNTGLVGGSVPAAGSNSVVVSLTRLNDISAVDPITGTVTCGAGTTLVELQRHAHAAGWEFGVDLAARDSATIGGMVATNAGGIHVVGYGMMRKQVLGLEVVLANGEVVRAMSGLTKDNTGYDLPQLFCGSEGTLGVITEVSLQLVRPQLTELLMFGVDTVSEALQIASSFHGSVAAAELIDRVSIESVSRVANIPVPFDTQFHLLLEVTGELNPDALSEYENLVAAADSTDRERMWALRERVTEASAAEAVGIKHKLDISFPLNALAESYTALQQLLDRPSVHKNAIFGHLLDGNYHLFFETDSEDHVIDGEVLELVHRFGGSISAEHGVGRMKAEYLHLSRSAAEIAAMKAIKGGLDPQGLMNPGVIFI